METITAIAVVIALSITLLQFGPRREAISLADYLTVCKEVTGLHTAKELWKDYAVALETAYECSREAEAYDCDDPTASLIGWERGDHAALAALHRLYQEDEYPDALDSAFYDYLLQRQA